MLEINIKDSYLLITMPLRDFPETFNIDNTIKEVISYDMYNETNCINDRFFSIEKAVEFIKNENKDVKQFLKNIKIWNLANSSGEKFDCIKYSIEYCKIDCLILRKGYNTFNTWMMELVNININECLTIASLAHRYFIESKCYDDVYQLSGIPQIFIQKCVVGGRTMVRENKKTIINNFIQALDARSLYPSAMYRLDGFLRGLPKVISNLNYDEVKNKDGYFIEVIIKSVGIKRKFPLLSFIDDNGVRQFTNDMIGKTVFIDKTTAEDIIKFQAVEFDVIRGYYFDEGFNTTIKDVIKNLYTERALKVKQENKSEIVYKLIMNSGYGKSIMKEIAFNTKIFNDDDEFYTYLSRNYNYVESFNKIEGSNKIIMKVIKPINNHFNIAHVGVSILSMSKRIMNEVICLAEDNNIDIFYQDTDSMSIEYENIETLRTKFNEKYNRELIGSNMHQFGYDLKLKYTDDKGKEQKAVNVVGIKGIYVGKKTYIVELKGNKKGTGEEVLGHYIRMKGIPNSCIKYTCKKLNLNPIQLYEKLYAGDKVDFDLTEEGNKSNFKFNKDFSINTIKSGMYSRKLQFN